MADGKALPKIVWTMWLQGFDEAPRLVKECVRSWRERNPGWEFRVLDRRSLVDFLSPEAMAIIDQPGKPIHALSDIVRINLLADHGGVWADATCFCCRALDTWIHDHSQTGFFTFLGHRKDTLISNWFLAARCGDYIAAEMRRSVHRYWLENSFPDPINQRLYYLLKAAINWHPRLTGWWLSFPVTRLLKVRPYFWFHYIFADRVRKNSIFRAQWEAMPKLDAVAPHKVQKFGLLKPVSPQLRRDVDEQADLVYKLNWKLHEIDPRCDASHFSWDTNLGYVLKSLDEH